MATDVAKNERYLPVAMKKDAMRLWLLGALEHAAMSQAELGRRLEKKLGSNFDRSFVNKMARGGRGIRATELFAIAEITDYAPPEPALQSGIINNSQEASVSVMVQGFARAGSWAKSLDLPQEEWKEIMITPVDEYPGLALHGCRVCDRAMDKIYPPGTILVWVALADTREEPISGKRYLVRRSNEDGSAHEVTVKTYIVNSSGRWLVNESEDPEWQGALHIGNDSDHIEIIGRVVRSIREE